MRLTEPSRKLRIERARERIAYELDVIGQMDFADYFLVVWEIGGISRGSRGYWWVCEGARRRARCFIA